MDNNTKNIKKNKTFSKKIAKLEYKSVAPISEYFYTLKVEFFDNKLNINVKGSCYEFNLKTERNKKFIQSILDDLNNLHIENWEDYYDLPFPYMVTDLHSWEIKLTYEDKKVKEINGYAVHPSNWEDFEKILQKLIPFETIKKYLIF